MRSGSRAMVKMKRPKAGPKAMKVHPKKTASVISAERGHGTGVGPGARTGRAPRPLPPPPPFRADDVTHARAAAAAGSRVPRRAQARQSREVLDVGKGPGRRRRAPGRPLQGRARSTSLAELKKRLVNALRHAVCPLGGPEQELDAMIPLGASQFGPSRDPVGTQPAPRGAWRGPHGPPVTAALRGPREQGLGEVCRPPPEVL